MKKILLFMTFFCFLLFSFSGKAGYSAVEKAEASAWVRDKAAQILDALSNRKSNEYSELDNLLVSSIDIPYIAKFVVGKYWRTMTEDQRQRYLELFNTYILEMYKTFSLPEDTTGIDFDIKGVTLKNKHTEVVVPIKIDELTTSADNPNGVIIVLFSIHKTDSGIKIIDLNVAGISLLMTFRNKIYELMQKDEEEVEWFLEDFETWIPSSTPKNEDL